MKLSKLPMFFAIITLLFISPVIYSQSNQDEVIRNFHSKIMVNNDNSLTVIETIDVTSKGIKIKHGIYREFPTEYEGIPNLQKVGFKVLSVKRDGKPIPYLVKDENNGNM